MSIRIVVADDHKLLREGLILLLQQQGFEVLGQAADGRHAVELVRQLQPSVVILDLSMPLLNGMDAARQIIAALPETRLIALSAHRDQRTVSQAFNAGITGYVFKD